ncbi:hypothetical protein DSL72_009513 [Monilinia vaccinii-corymbosi]|uniref:Uncharacterized protein n=1 Tax=Monilinia vaccinii-corymbosi TaxID=61207 RepID=A0A8A3PRC1_9HELO|nr:hypothetical protein DSL72_009513 [Monilinia vaccinii-corymbosi]
MEMEMLDREEWSSRVRMGEGEDEGEGGVERGLMVREMRGAGGGKKKVERGWINWDRWGVCVGFVLSNILLFIPLAYLIATHLIPAPWRWMGFIVCHHVMLTAGYEVAMDIRDGWVEEMEGEAELERWDRVVEGLEAMLEGSRRGTGRERLVVGAEADAVARVLRVGGPFEGVWRTGVVEVGEGEGKEARRED